MGWLSDKLFGKKAKLDLNKIADFQSGTQGLVTEQLGLSRQLMDPNSAINQQMSNMMAQRANQTGANIGLQMNKMGAMSGVSPAQAMMQARIGMHNQMGQVNQNWMQNLQSQFSQGLGLMGNMTGMQQGLDENLANAYVQDINARNQARANRMNMASGLLGGAMSMAGQVWQGAGVNPKG